MTAEQTLVLNASYEPLKVVHWQRAMVLWAQGKVEVVETHDREARSVTFSFRLPSVVRLLRFVRSRAQRETVPFTRANIYLRDSHECQYCGARCASEELTFDHVVPASRGGQRSWTNIVSACYPCNRRKGPRTPAEAGMALRRQPVKPSPAPVFRVTLGLRRVPECWKDWLAGVAYWHAELEG